MSIFTPRSGEGRAPDLVVVSNRRPFTVKQRPSGPVVEKSAGGLVAAVSPLLESRGGTWVAWDGLDAARGLEGVEATRTRQLEAEASFCRFVPVRLTAREISRYYYGFANQALWPLAHFFIGRSHFEAEHFREYERVNRKFADATREAARPGDRLWIHDYHLTLVPQLLREKDPSLGPIGFFWHIPFPSWDVFRVLPWRREILRGMVGADLVGFHLESYAENFRDSVRRCLGYRQAGADLIAENGRRVKVGGFPIGIDVEKIESLAESAPIRRRAQQMRRRAEGRQIVLSVDRLDYSKGILERLTSLEHFFDRSPRWRGKVDFIQVAVPSRTRVEEYRAIKRQIEEAVGRINGRFSDEGWMPIRYLYRSFPLEELLGTYLAADVALVTPVRDGMNLVAMEYVTSHVEGDGALVLSELAGVSEILEGAYVVNPFHPEAVAEAVEAALTDPASEKRERMERMREQIRTHDVFGWHERFWKALAPERRRYSVEPEGAEALRAVERE